MKKIFLMLAFVAGTAVVANAQTKAPKSPDQRAQHRTAALTKKLNLSADQSAKVNAILLKQASQMDSLKANKPADRKANFEAHKAVFANTDAQIKAVLKPDQQTAYANLKTEMKGKGHGRHHGNKTPDQKAQRLTGVLTKKLSLNADQSAKVNAILLQSATQMDSLKANNPADRAAKKESRKAILANADTQLKAVFTADQQKTYADLKAKMIEKMKAKRGAKQATPNAG
ncbi:hypothetical protein D0C36_07880 [Mucilaginibacter conchicola]|uniref:LTXXQ motif family protein n=1 Tax=Mucilaginibacter conchicola TaxID=2303333 RepID=A0A372NZU6_9SPHI|nr:hypothetical protein [Mucilaginibacter conchicola]RFZ95431.1 hypothetical protein D0C36_07880 [Mucilaginibacter conchicola]